MKLPHTKFGLACYPRGAQVTMTYQGRTLLGDVVGVRRDEVTGAIMLSVRHFNGEPWPVDPSSWAVDVLERVYEDATRAPAP